MFPEEFASFTNEGVHMFRMSLVLVFAMGLSTCFAGADGIPVTVHDGGQQFGVVIEIDYGQKTAQSVPVYAVPKAGREIAVLPAGEHSLCLHQHRHGFPQDADLEVTRGGKALYKARIYDHAHKINLQAGDKVSLSILPAHESYNAKFGSLKGVPVALVWARPYWYQDVTHPWVGRKEDFPNTPFFFADKEKWGADKVFDDLAELTAKTVKSGNVEHGDHRGQCHIALMVALTADGKYPTVLTDLSEKDLQSAVKAECLRLHEQMLKINCFRTWNSEDIRALKEAGYLPKSIPAEPGLHLTLGESLPLAEMQLKAWQATRKKK